MPTNKYREAFRETANLIGMSGALAVSAALLTPIPLFVCAAAEVAYLLFVPDTRWYEIRLAKRFDAEVEARRKALKDKIVPTLRTEIQNRFLRLEGVRAQITTQSQDEEHWFREVLRKLDYLLEKFLLFASKESQFSSYLQSLISDSELPSTGQDQTYTLHGVKAETRRSFRQSERGRRIEFDIPEASGRDGESAELEKSKKSPDDQRIQTMVERIQQYYTQEKARVEGMLETEQDENTKAVLQKRTDVLERRREYVGKIGGILGNLNQQLHLVEETFGLINDEIRARSPEQVLADIDEVVVATESMTETLEELAPYEQMTARLSG